MRFFGPRNRRIDLKLALGVDPFESVTGDSSSAWAETGLAPTPKMVVEEVGGAAQTSGTVSAVQTVPSTGLSAAASWADSWAASGIFVFIF